MQDRKFRWNFRWYFRCLTGSSGQPDKKFRLGCERCARIWENTSGVWPELQVHDQKFRSTSGSSGPWTGVRIGAFAHALARQNSLSVSDRKFWWNFWWVRVSHNGQICLDRGSNGQIWSDRKFRSQAPELPVPHYKYSFPSFLTGKLE